MGDLRQFVTDALDALPDRGAEVAVIEAGFRDYLDRRFHGRAQLLRAVNEHQRSLRQRTDPLVTAGTPAGPFDEGRTVGEAASYSVTIDDGRFLYSLAANSAPNRIIEVGTNLGVSALYLAAALHGLGSGTLWTLEASAPRLSIATAGAAELGLDPFIRFVPGFFEDTLAPTIDEHGPFDMAFVDGNHTAEATTRYFELLRGPGALLVFDDIRWSDGMRTAWARIAAADDVSIALDLGRMGLVLCR